MSRLEWKENEFYDQLRAVIFSIEYIEKLIAIENFKIRVRADY